MIFAMAVRFVISRQNSNYQHCFTYRQIIAVYWHATFSCDPEHFQCLNNITIFTLINYDNENLLYGTVMLES